MRKWHYPHHTPILAEANFDAFIRNYLSHSKSISPTLVFTPRDILNIDRCIIFCRDGLMKDESVHKKDNTADYRFTLTEKGTQRAAFWVL